MNLSRHSRETARWPVSAEGATLAEVWYVNAASTSPTWETTTLNAEGTEVSALLAGPDATPGTARVLPLGRTLVLFRFTIGDEKPVRDGGVIDVK